MHDGVFLDVMGKAAAKTTWVRFVRQVVGDQRQSTVARRAGIDQTTVSRWMRGDLLPAPPTAVTFARAYDVDPVDALVAAGLITSEEATPHSVATVLDAVPTPRLVDELARRTRADRNETTPA